MNVFKGLRGNVLLAAFLSVLFFSACSSRKYTTKSNTSTNVKAADAMSHLKNKQLYKFITDWTGVKYRFGGLDKRGIDCSGFALLLQKDIYGNKLPRRSRDQAEAIRKKSLDSLKEGDLIFFSFGGGAVDHVGIYLNNNFFVHASTTRGVVIDDLTTPAYQRAFVKAGTISK